MLMVIHEAKQFLSLSKKMNNIFLGSLEILSLIPIVGIRKDYMAEMELAEFFPPFFLLLYLRISEDM